MSTPRLTGPRTDEQGAVAVVVAITLTLLLMMAGFAIDLGMTRVDTGREQSASDMAAAAGAATLDVLETVWNARGACLAALDYAVANLPGGPASPVDGRTCESRFAIDDSCDDFTTPRTAQYSVDRFEILITLPVPDGPGLMQDVNYGTEWDGHPCERVGVSVTASRQHFFAQIGENVGLGNESTRGAVGRAYADGDDEAYASLIVLHPTTCQAIDASNVGAEIRVGSVTEGGEVHPGVITVYSVPPSGNCTSTNNQVINLGGVGTDAFITADGFIISYGLQSGASANQIYSAEKVANGNLSPRPIRGPAVTRSDIDHDYNCLDPYPTAATAPKWRPNRASLPYSDCTDGGPNHVQRIQQGYNGFSADDDDPALDNLPDGWLVFPRDFGGDCGSAQLDPNDPLPAYTGPADDPPGYFGTRLFIDCNPSGGGVFKPDSFNLDGWDVVVSRGGIDVSTGDQLTVTGHAEKGTVLYIQNGSIAFSGGSFTFDGVFVYLDDGRFDLGGSTGNIFWAPPHPDIADNCADLNNVDSDGNPTISAPNGACFAKLSMWGNRVGSGPQDRNRIGGGATLVAKGIFFSPNNRMTVRGSGDNAPLDCDPSAPLPPGVKLNLREAQFWSNTIDVGGGGVITLCPSTVFGKEIQFPGSGLIR